MEAQDLINSIDLLEENIINSESELTPDAIVAELDRYVISQLEAKKAVAIALRNRWRRLQVNGELKDEITPKNIMMIGPTGVGKTEISRRLAKLVKAPFIKIEATKYTEVGYVGRDVDSIIRDLMEASYQMVREEEKKRVLKKAENLAEERLLDVLLPSSKDKQEEVANFEQFLTRTKEAFGSPLKTPLKSEKTSQTQVENRSELEEQKDPQLFEDLEDFDLLDSAPEDDELKLQKAKAREKLREMLLAGKLEEKIVAVESAKQVHTHMQVLGPHGIGEIEGQIKDMFSSMVPRQKELKKLSIKEARKFFTHEAQESLVNHEQISELARYRCERTGIVFIDEVDKICAGGGGKGPDVSREGVQRDLLPLVEGTTVSTKYGSVKTEHILFIASGAFHVSKPADLMPEFQGRFPIRVELKSLTPEHFVRILTEPKNALIKQYAALLGVEGLELKFTDDGISELAKLTAEVNSRTENIGARRLHTLLEKLLEEVSFSAHEYAGKTVKIDQKYVQDKLSGIVEDVDLSRFIL